MILLLLLLYVISLVKEGKGVNCKVRFLEGWPVGKIVTFPEYLARL